LGITISDLEVLRGQGKIGKGFHRSLWGQ